MIPNSMIHIKLATHQKRRLSRTRIVSLNYMKLKTIKPIQSQPKVTSHLQNFQILNAFMLKLLKLQGMKNTNHSWIFIWQLAQSNYSKIKQFLISTENFLKANHAQILMIQTITT